MFCFGGLSRTLAFRIGRRRFWRKPIRSLRSWFSGITLWEIATLNSLGRVELDLPLRDWLEQAVAPPLVQLVAITPAIAAEVAALPDSFHRDPADRILVASARTLGAALLTQDRRIIDSGLIPTIP